jgi:mRNA-degrading endonuclease YafQ of YafQ-DinJ toxin-antitoxin module
MTISQTTAAKLADFLLTNRNEKLLALQANLVKLAKEEYLNSLPEAIIQMFNSNHKGYLNTTHQVQDPALDWAYVYFKQGLPSLGNNTFSFSGTFKKDFNKYEVLNSTFKKDREKLISTIFSLRTAKRIKEIFPELVDHELLGDQKKMDLISYEGIHKLYK